MAVGVVPIGATPDTLAWRLGVWAERSVFQADFGPKTVRSGPFFRPGGHGLHETRQILLVQAEGSMPEGLKFLRLSTMQNPTQLEWGSEWGFTLGVFEPVEHNLSTKRLCSNVSFWLILAAKAAKITEFCKLKLYLSSLIVF